MKELLNQIRLKIIRIFLNWIVSLAPRNHPEGRVVLRGIIDITGRWKEYYKNEGNNA